LKYKDLTLIVVDCLHVLSNLNVYKNQQNQQTGSRNLMGSKTLPTIWYTYMTLVTKYQISAIYCYWEKCDEKYLGWHIFLSNSCDIWSQTSYRYAILWEAFLDPSDSYFLFADLVGFYTHWTMIPPLFGKQEVGIWRVKKRFPWYGVSIWSLWSNIRSLPSIVAEKNVTKNVHICSMCINLYYITHFVNFVYANSFFV
jgi:hypothetical protein